MKKFYFKIPWINYIYYPNLKNSVSINLWNFFYYYKLPIDRLSTIIF